MFMAFPYLYAATGRCLINQWRWWLPIARGAGAMPLVNAGATLHEYLSGALGYTDWRTVSTCGQSLDLRIVCMLAHRNSESRRMRPAYGSILVLCWSLLTLPALADGEVVLSLDFVNEEDLSAYEWLYSRDFELERAADDRDKIEFFRDEGGLNIRTREPAFGLAVRKLLVPAARRMRLHWGVADYPQGASYQHGIDNEAVMVMVFFGEQRLPSGEVFIPDSPYFIGFYLCPPAGDDVDQPYKGHHYEKTGRYICVQHAQPGEAVVSEVDLQAVFLNSFGLPRMPVVSGISIEIDTTDAGNDGHAAAFIRRLDFMD